MFSKQHSRLGPAARCFEQALHCSASAPAAEAARSYHEDVTADDESALHDIPLVRSGTPSPPSPPKNPRTNTRTTVMHTLTLNSYISEMIQGRHANGRCMLLDNPVSKLEGHITAAGNALYAHVTGELSKDNDRNQPRIFAFRQRAQTWKEQDMFAVALLNSALSGGA